MQKRDDVTIITQVSVDRLSRIADMADTWQGKSGSGGKGNSPVI